MTQESKNQEELNTGEAGSQPEASEGTATKEEQTLSLEERLAQKEAEISALQDRLLRMAAEMENTRKRLEREKLDGISFANESLLRDLLPVVDNLERAMQHCESDAGTEGLFEGVKMTLKVFMDVLNRYGCKPFDSEGQPFDPNFHEAMMQEPSEEHAENTVLKEFQKGYMLHDRLLRPAMVIVAKPAK